MGNKSQDGINLFNKPGFTWSIVAILVLIIVSLAVYSWKLKSELVAAKVPNITIPSPTVSPSPSKTPTPAQPTATPGVDEDNVYTNSKTFTYSFEHLDGYKVEDNGDNSLSISKLLPDGSTERAFINPNNLGVSFVNYYTDGIRGRIAKERPYTKEGIYDWIEARATAAQCYNGVEIAKTIASGVPVYKAAVKCGAFYQIQYTYYVELHKRNGDFLVINSFDSEQSEQIPLLLKTFSLINQ